MTEAELDRLSAAGELLTVSRTFGNVYAWRKVDLNDASTSPEFRMLDFKISLRALLSPFQPLEIVVLPPDEPTLRLRVRRAGRTEREAAIVADYREHYAGARSDRVPGAGRPIVVVSEEGKPEVAARRVLDAALTERAVRARMFQDWAP